MAGCTGPTEGFVYGGDPGKVLNFVRRGREDSGGGSRGAVDGRPALADVLRWFWKLKHDRGVLAYKVSEELETRKGVGAETGWEVVFTRNVGKTSLSLLRAHARTCMCWVYLVPARVYFCLRPVVSLTAFP